MIKNLHKTILISVICFVSTINTVRAEIHTASIPQQIYYRYHNDNFTVRVRQVGNKDWIDLYEYKVKVDMDTNSDATMVQFDFSGQVEIFVQLNNGKLDDVVIRPLERGITPEIEDNHIKFTIDHPQKLSIEFNGDRLHNLHLFANSLETYIPHKDNPDVVYFEPGMHEADNADKTFRIESNTTVYLAPGAVLRGTLNCDSTENVHICGRGIILEPQYGIRAGWVKNFTVEDISVINPRFNTITAGSSENVTIRNIKSFSHQGWGDGLDFYCSKHVLVDNVFLRNSDDCIAIYSHRWNFYGDTYDIIVKNSTLWADIAHPINIGTHGNTETEGEIIENVTFRNIDVLEHDEDDRDYQGVMTINSGDCNIVRNVTFDSIRVEHIQEGQLFHLRVMDLPKYCSAPGRKVEHITFSNIQYTGAGENPSVIKGFSEEGKVSDILFDNIVINGRRARKPEDLNLNIGLYVQEIQIK